jgi:hypothetical protein
MQACRVVPIEKVVFYIVRFTFYEATYIAIRLLDMPSLWQAAVFSLEG